MAILKIKKNVDDFVIYSKFFKLNNKAMIFSELSQFKV